MAGMKCEHYVDCGSLDREEQFRFIERLRRTIRQVQGGPVLTDQ